MSETAKATSIDTYKQVKTVLISQPKPERSPFFDLGEKWDLKIDWRPFIYVKGVSEKDFRKNRVRPDEYPAIIFTSKNAIEHFFRLAEEMRVSISQSTRYFCLTKAIADYLQKFILYRKRKVFVGVRKIEDLTTALNKFKETETFLLPTSNLGSKDVVSYLEKNNFNFKDVMMYETLSSDLSDLSDVTYDILVFYSPLGIESLYENFPDFSQKGTRMAIYGKSTQKAVTDKGLKINIAAPAPEMPSMTMAIEHYLKKSNK